ncbi:hypothetical protein GC173_01455 [bacterium]|nr:hypothetical protein [bacterium]
MLTRSFARLMAAGCLLGMSVAVHAADGVEPLEERWSVERGAPLNETSVMRAYGLKLFCAGNGEAGPVLHSTSLEVGRISDTVESVPLEGIPAALRLADIQPVPSAIRFALGGEVDGKPVVYTAEILGDAALGAWEPALAIPSPQPETLTALGSSGEFLVAFTRRAIESGTVNTGWVINLAAPDADKKWIELTFDSSRRSGHASLALDSMLLLAGGVREDGSGPVGMVDLMPFDGLKVSPWNKTFPPVPGVVREVVGASSTQGAFLLPQVTSTDKPTSTTVYTSFNMGNNRLSPWTANPAVRAAEPVRATTFDPANSQLIVMTGAPGSETVRLNSYAISPLAVARRPTMADAERDRMAQLAPKIAAVNVDDAILQAREKGSFVFVIITDGSPDQDLRTRMEIGKSAFRYMIGTSETTLLSGAAGAEVAKRFGVSGTPAFLVINNKGALEKSFSGKLPTPPEMLELTAPIRAPRDPR